MFIIIAISQISLKRAHLEGICIALWLLRRRLLKDEFVHLAIRCHLRGDLNRARRDPRLTTILTTTRLLFISLGLSSIVTSLYSISWRQVISSSGLYRLLRVCHVIVLIINDVRL